MQTETTPNEPLRSGRLFGLAAHLVVNALLAMGWIVGALTYGSHGHKYWMAAILLGGGLALVRSIIRPNTADNARFP